MNDFDVIGIRVIHRTLSGKVERKAERTFEHEQASDLIEAWNVVHEESKCTSECTTEVFRLVGDDFMAAEYSLDIEQIKALV